MDNTVHAWFVRVTSTISIDLDDFNADNGGNMCRRCIYRFLRRRFSRSRRNDDGATVGRLMGVLWVVR